MQPGAGCVVTSRAAQVSCCSAWLDRQHRKLIQDQISHRRKDRLARKTAALPSLVEHAALLAGEPLAHIGLQNSLIDAVNACGPIWQPWSGAAAGGSSVLPPRALLALADLATALQPACFDEECSRQKDLLLVASLAVPLLVLGASVAWLLRPPPEESLKDGSLFEDKTTGTLFEAPSGSVPERDRKGELAFRAISYTPWPVEEGVEGERLRIEVGPVGERKPRTYVFSKVLPQPSQLVVTTLERPLGLVFEEDARRKRAVVAGFAPGGHAEQLAKRAALNPALAATAPLEGDVLRACTATTIQYQPAALAFGMQQPQRAVVVFGADGQGWPQTMAALKRGLLADGPVTLVLERRLPRDEVASSSRAAAAAQDA